MGTKQVTQILPLLMVLLSCMKLYLLYKTEYTREGWSRNEHKINSHIQSYLTIRIQGKNRKTNKVKKLFENEQSSKCGTAVPNPNWTQKGK